MDARECLAGVFANMRDYDLEWLAGRVGSAPRILDVGCGQGYGLLALMCRLGAAEGLGVDNKPDQIELARGVIRDIKSALEDSSIIDCQGLQTEVPEFLRKGTFPSFRVADITCSEQLTWMQPGHFDLAYCDTVLIHILGEYGEPGVVDALVHMARAVRPSGWIATREGGVWAGGLFGLERLLREAGLEMVYSKQKEIAGRFAVNGVPPELLVLARVGTMTPTRS